MGEIISIPTVRMGEIIFEIEIISSIQNVWWGNLIMFGCCCVRLLKNKYTVKNAARDFF